MNIVRYTREYYVCYINEEGEFSFKEITLIPFEIPTATTFKIKIIVQSKNPYECINVVSWSLISCKENF
jgi:hypothetical protein